MVTFPFFMNSLALSIAQEAGVILKSYFGKNLSVQFKNNDPTNFLTKADVEVDQFIRERIQKAFPGDSILSEENKSIPPNYTGRVWVVDPLDGTKDFVHGSKSFGVSIGLCIKAIPQFGAVYIPMHDELYYAEKGKGAFLIKSGKKTSIHVSKINTLSQARMYTRNNYHGERPLDRILEKIKVKETIAEGSIVFKICLIASGKAELYLNTNFYASKWDTCAAQIILQEAGGVITDIDGKPLNYNQESIAWKNSFVVSNWHLHPSLISAISEIRKKGKI